MTSEIVVQVQNSFNLFSDRPQSWSRNSEFLLDSEDNKLNLVIIGSDGLSDQLAQEIRVSREVYMFKCKYFERFLVNY